MKKIYFTIFALILFSASLVSAQGLLVDKTNIDGVSSEFSASAGLTSRSVGSIAADVINIALSFLGLIFLSLILVSGFQWMTSNGNEEVISKAKKRLINSVIGLIVILAAYGITYFIFEGLPFTGSSSMPDAG